MLIEEEGARDEEKEGELEGVEGEGEGEGVEDEGENGDIEEDEDRDKGFSTQRLSAAENLCKWRLLVKLEATVRVFTQSVRGV